MKKRLKQLSTFGLAAALSLGIFAPTALVSAEGDDPQFYTAYFIWDCNGFCSRKLNNIQGEANGSYPTNYYRADSMWDEIGHEKVLDISSVAPDTSRFGFLTEAGYARFQSEGWTSSWGDPLERVRSITDDWESEHELIYDPMGGRVSNNSINTNANRDFRLTIFGDDFEAIRFSDIEESYTYFPKEVHPLNWDPHFIDSTVDISGTSLSSPAIYETYLLEPNLKFSSHDFSASPIVSVRATNVNNPNAVSVTKNDDQFTITFNSNYHQKVDFELTAENGDKYYLQVNRVTGKEYMNIGEKKLGYWLMYNSSKSYNDYDVIATIGHEDGSISIKKATPIAIDDFDEEGPATKVEWNAGKNLKSAVFAIDGENDITSLDFTVVSKDAFKTADVYGGTFAGSGKGIHFDDDLLNRFIIHVYSN